MGRLNQVTGMAVAHPVHRLTEAEYLEIERRAEFKSEFFEGEMFAMSGGTGPHSLIACNLIREFGNRLKDCPCFVYNSDMRVKVQVGGLYTYPDVSIVCGQDQFEDEQEDILLNPTVIVEVLSESGEAYDRGQKFELYRRLPSLREYLLVSQSKPLVEQYVRQDSGEWLLREVAGLEAKLTLPSVHISVEMAEVYHRVKFPPARLRSVKPGGAR